ncbi:MAG TPA: glycosyltransferase family 2 protein [Bacteroidales bacterium]|nr:glycosyltransferase family 2 protein [Bacteroidales bacterium]
MIAIITINYNLSGETIPCVESILKSEYPNYRVYLIDNGSAQDDYNKLLEAFNQQGKVNVLRIEKNCGYVGGVNFGLQKAMESNPDYFLVMNNDTIIDKEAIGYLVYTAQRHKNNAIVSGKVYYYDRPDVLQHTGEIITDHRYLKTFAPGKNEKDTGQFDEEIERDALDDVFWLLPLGLVKDVGFYCNYFFLYAEQGDYALRAKKKGYKLIYTPDAKLWHKVSMTTGGGNTHSPKVCYWRGQGLFVLHYRHLKIKYLILSILKKFVTFSALALFKKENKRNCAIAMLRGYFWGFCWMFNKRPNNGYNPYN